MLGETSSKKSRNKELRALLSGARVEIEVFLGETELAMKTILELEAGDMIRLNSKADETVTVAVDKKDKFMAKIGTQRYRKAIKISKFIVNEHDSVKDLLKKLEFERNKKLEDFKEEVEVE
jgi:flagellar motor switch protein FliM